MAEAGIVSHVSRACRKLAMRAPVASCRVKAKLHGLAQLLDSEGQRLSPLGRIGGYTEGGEISHLVEILPLGSGDLEWTFRSVCETLEASVEHLASQL